jgi:hypothetical protein
MYNCTVQSPRIFLLIDSVEMGERESTYFNFSILAPLPFPSSPWHAISNNVGEYL